MIRSPHDPVRLITPPRRDHHGGFSPAWLLIQAARLSWEIRNILQLINGRQLNLSDELAVHSEASDMLFDAAHATAVMEARLPLAPAWGSGPPRSRAIFAQAREAGSDPADVCVDVIPPRPRIDPQVALDMRATFREDPEPGAQCAGMTVKKEQCTKTIVEGIASQHCSVHLTPAERKRYDALRAAQDRHRQAIQDALKKQRLALATTWIQRYGGHRPHRLDLPTPPRRSRQIIPFNDHPSTQPGDDHALLALYDTGWPTLCPRSAEIINALLECPRATTARLANIAAAQTPHRWPTAEQWLASCIWDGIRPPDVCLPASHDAPELDELPVVQSLRDHLSEAQREWEGWRDGFSTLVEACDDPPLDTMADLLAFWQDIGILVADGDEAGAPVWALQASPPSPWRVLYTRGTLVSPHLLAAALDWLLNGGTPLDAELPPRDVFNLLLASNTPPRSPAGSVVGGAACAGP
ncbi:hypothetical protein ABZ897_60655 [Nonomuraea sp. NPDC046802]|uniref:hypothetical protein n=1 Tax=Nonomuraea sp. NPDC046802 TaxID=3154919 RepID=UPI0033D0D68F